MQQVATGVWMWQTPHPDWTLGEDWPALVSSYAIDVGARLVIFDPLGTPDEILGLAGERPIEIVLTCPWHRRDAEALAARLEVPLHVPPPDPASDEPPVRGQVYEAGQAVVDGVEARPGMEHNDLVLWIEGHRLLVAGDTLVDRGSGLEVPTEWARGTPREQILAGLRPLLELGATLVLPTHGEPVPGDELAKALR